MQFFPFKLRQSDQQQFNLIKNQISEIRLLVNRSLDNLEKELIQKVDQLIQNKNNDQLQKMEEIVFKKRISDPDFYLNEISCHLTQFTKCNENKLIHHEDEELNLLNFQFASKLLSNTQMFLKTMFSSVSLRIQQNLKIANTKVISTQSENDQNQIWKHKNIAKTNDRDTSFAFSKNYGLAENILALTNLILIGIYITPLFKGINQFDQNINDQDKEVKFCIKIHEGIDMSQFVYSEDLIIKHKQYKLVNKCYEIILKEGVILRQGLVYTLSITSLNEENINLHMFQGKCVNFGGDLKFLGKETENMSQIVNIKQNIAQSCMPGILIGK